MVSDRLKLAFFFLACAQAAHSLEEYLGRLWEVFIPARFLTNLISETNPVLGFLVINVSLVAFGFFCYFYVVRPATPTALPWIWFWVLLETVNGVGHTVWAIISRTYQPGLLTAPAFLILVPIMVFELRRARVSLDS